MKLAFVNSSYQLGGAETVAQDLAAGSAAAGHATRFYVGGGRSIPRARNIVPMYPRLLSRLHHSRYQSVLERYAPKATWTDRHLRRLATGWPDLVHLHNFHGEYATVESLAFLARRKPLIWTHHGHWGITGGCDHPVACTRYLHQCGECPQLGLWPIGAVDDTGTRLQEKLDHLEPLNLHVVAPARHLAARIAQSRVGRRWHVHHIPNGVSAAAFSPARKHDEMFKRSLGIEPDRLVVLVVSRNFKDPQKGFIHLRAALSAAAALGERVQVILAGENSDWAVAQLPSSLPTLSVGYVTERERLARLFEASSIFLFASPAETFPCVILEAMAAGCCIVATPTSGVTEQIDDGVSGALAESINGPALARALLAIADDPGAVVRMGQEAREKARTTFSIERMIQSHLRLYGEVVAEWTHKQAGIAEACGKSAAVDA